MPDHITINLLHVWLVVKAAVAVYITKKELQYPIWSHGVQRSRGIHHVIRAFLRNAAVNPEWALMKLLAFLPFGAFTGKKHLWRFLPWHIASPPPLCAVCKDTGQHAHTFIKGMTKKEMCTCPAGQLLAHEYDEHSTVSLEDLEGVCVCCKGTKDIGAGRPCPHCKLREDVKALDQKKK